MPTYAMHDRQIRREVRVLSGGGHEEVEDLTTQERAVRNRLRDAERRLKGQRIAELTAAGLLPFPAATDDSRRLARAWLGRYLPEEKEALVRRLVADAGVAPSAIVHIRSIPEKITCCNGWLAAPLTDAVRQLLELDGPAFRRRIFVAGSPPTNPRPRPRSAGAAPPGAAPPASLATPLRPPRRAHPPRPAPPERLPVGLRRHLATRELWTSDVVTNRVL
ncbi:hypothetical protein [Streptomyces afghaniensis]|uniref:hypothetical protein n=1 Tax=Streptomyces afghaniensis TaxID=66865 RepID=UPI0027D7D126|nr:hypothetical protein [Streptomyces afghaniensis]